MYRRVCKEAVKKNSVNGAFYDEIINHWSILCPKDQEKQS
jgi:hypothetical protein